MFVILLIIFHDQAVVARCLLDYNSSCAEGRERDITEIQTDVMRQARCSDRDEVSSMVLANMEVNDKRALGK